MKKYKILIVEDDERIAGILKQYLKASNFNVTTLISGNMVKSNVQDNPPDLILLDIMLPDMDGMEICREIRSFSNIPIIIVTAKVDDIDRLLGLEFGADDYICKPFLPAEVVARVKSVLRRTYSAQEKDLLVIGSLVMDNKAHIVKFKGSMLDLTPIEYHLLKIMMAAPNKVFTRVDFLSQIQGYSKNVYDRTIDNHIKNLRKKFNLHAPDRDIVQTVFGIGYKLNLQKKSNNSGVTPKKSATYPI